MKDAFERRALLLQLGRTLQLLARILEVRPGAPGAATIGELIELNPILESEVLLEHVSASLSVEDFVARTLKGFCRWPQALLDEKLDHDAFAVSVRDALFGQNQRGWHGYATGVRAEVGWFGLEPTGRQGTRRRKGARAIALPQRRADVSSLSDTAPSRDIERDNDDTDQTSEGVEALSAPRGARRTNEQYLPEFE